MLSSTVEAEKSISKARIATLPVRTSEASANPNRLAAPVPLATV
jgi:hypothetical protein